MAERVKRRAWPTFARRDAERVIAYQKEIRRRGDRALESINEMDWQSARVDVLHSIRHAGQSIETLMEALAGEPDDLAQALDMIRQLLADVPEHHPIAGRAQALLARYEEGAQER
jgi:hypothetical protein